MRIVAPKNWPNQGKKMAEFPTGSNSAPAVIWPSPFYENNPTPADKGTIPIRKTNSSDHTYLDYRLRADLSSSN
jgi:hypothetical protein